MLEELRCAAEDMEMAEVDTVAAAVGEIVVVTSKQLLPIPSHFSFFLNGFLP